MAFDYSTQSNIPPNDVADFEDDGSFEYEVEEDDNNVSATTSTMNESVRGTPAPIASTSGASSTAASGASTSKKRKRSDVIQTLRDDQEKRFQIIKESIAKVDESDDMFGKFFASMADIARKWPKKYQIKVTRLVNDVMSDLQEAAFAEEEETIIVDLPTFDIDNLE